MAILLIAEHDNSTLSDQDRQGPVGSHPVGRRRSTCWLQGKGAQAAADAAAKLAGVKQGPARRKRRAGRAGCRAARRPPS